MNINFIPAYCVIANREQVLSSCTTCADINLCYDFLVSPVDSSFFYKSSSIALIISTKRIDDRTFSQRRICDISLYSEIYFLKNPACAFILTSWIFPQTNSYRFVCSISTIIIQIAVFINSAV